MTGSGGSTPDSTEAYPLTTANAAYPGATLATGTQLADSSVTGSAGDLNVTLETWVIQGSSANPYVNGTDGSIPNALSFVYQLTDNAASAAVIEAFDVASWANGLTFVPTDVGYYTNGIADDPNYNPGSVSRTGPATDNFINWSFAGAFSIPPGGNQSDFLIINTNGTNYVMSSASVQNDTNLKIGSLAAFAPGPALTPEPSSIVMMMLGLIGLGFAARARGRRAS